MNSVNTSPMTHADASSYNVLVVEDEYLIAADLIRALRQDGLNVVGPVARPSAAIGALDRVGVDYAVVDINLEGALSFVVASELRRRAIPFLFLTGYDPAVIPTEFGDVQVLQKPNGSDTIVATIRRQRAGATGAERPTVVN